LKYSLVYTHRAVKDIEGLEEKIKNRIAKTLLRYSEDPFKYAEKLTDSMTSTIMTHGLLLFLSPLPHYFPFFSLEILNPKNLLANP